MFQIRRSEKYVGPRIGVIMALSVLFIYSDSTIFLHKSIQGKLFFRYKDLFFIHD